MYMMDNSLHKFINRLDTAEQRMSEFEKRPIEIIHHKRKNE